MTLGPQPLITSVIDLWESGSFPTVASATRSLHRGGRVGKTLGSQPLITNVIDLWKSGGSRSLGSQPLITNVIDLWKSGGSRSRKTGPLHICQLLLHSTAIKSVFPFSTPKGEKRQKPEVSGIAPKLQCLPLPAQLQEQPAWSPLQARASNHWGGLV